MQLHRTGNEYVALSHIGIDGALYALNLLSGSHKGLLQLAADGAMSEPLLNLVVYYRGERLTLDSLQWDCERHWIPVASYSGSGLEIQIRWIAPPSQKAFAILADFRSSSADEEINPEDIVCSLEGCWGELDHHVYLRRELAGTFRAWESPWKNGLVCEFAQNQVVLATCISCSNKNFAVLWAGTDLAPRSPEELAQLPRLGSEPVCAEGCDELRFAIAAEPRREGDRVRIAFHIGFGVDAMSAVTASAHLDRLGSDAICEETARVLEALEMQVSDPVVSKAVNRNAMFCKFFSTGRTYDTEQFCCVTSRTTDYYVSAAYWDRDALFWSFPSILQQDQRSARELLEYAFTTQVRNTGVHSRFIDGTILEPGLELDQLCAPVIELVHYIRLYNDFEFPRARFIQDAIRELRHKVMGLKCKNALLFNTFLNSTDDVPPYSVVTYHNVMAWRFFFDLAFLDEKLSAESTRSVENRNMALRLRRDIYAHCVREVNGKHIFAYSVPIDNEPMRFDPLTSDEDSQKRVAGSVYDDPMGSLITLPYWGFCKYYDPVYENTVKAVLSDANLCSSRGARFEYPGAYHAKSILGPFVASIANQLLVRINQQQIRDTLENLHMDDGLACESIDASTGKVATGYGMASMAGFWAYAMYRGLAKVPSYGWPEATADDIAKTEGAVLIAAHKAGLPYPRAEEQPSQQPAARPSARPKPAPARPQQTQTPSPYRRPAPTGANRGRYPGAPTVIPEDLPDDIGNRAPVDRKADRRPSGFGLSDDLADF